MCVCVCVCVCEFYMSVNIVVLLGTSEVSRLYLEVCNCGRLSKVFSVSFPHIILVA